MKVALNDYYLDTIDGIIGRLKHSTPGRRVWYESSTPGWSYDYTGTERSTFPDWISFWFRYTPKRERIEYIISNREPYEDGYFNGNTKELWGLLNRARNTGVISKRSKRILVAFDYIVSGYLEEFEYLDMENCPF